MIRSSDRWRRICSVGLSTQQLLDRVTSLARERLDVAAVCLSLADAERRLLTSSYGLPVPTALLLSHAFQRHVTASNRPLVVTDGRSDPLFMRIPALRDGMVRACVGIPLRAADNRAAGILLAMDQRPRLWTAPQIALLGSLSSLIESETVLGAPKGSPPKQGAPTDGEAGATQANATLRRKGDKRKPSHKSVTLFLVPSSDVREEAVRAELG